MSSSLSHSLEVLRATSRSFLNSSVLCINKNSQFRVTDVLINSLSSLTKKDNFCLENYGNDFRAASVFEITNNLNTCTNGVNISIMYNTSDFNLLAHSSCVPVKLSTYGKIRTGVFQKFIPQEGAYKSLACIKK